MTRTARIPFPANIDELLARMSDKALAAELGCAKSTIHRMRKERGVYMLHEFKGSGGKALKPMPADFASRADGMTLGEICVAFDCSVQTARRWRKEAGLGPAKTGYAPGTAIVRRARQPANHPWRSKKAPVDRAYVDTSLVGRAADYLRRFGPVYRCNDEGRPSIGGRFWRRGGGGVLTDAEIVERAEFNGFDAAAWKRVAA